MSVASSASLRFGENLRKHRRRRGLTQERVGKLSNLHRTEVGKLESGEREPRMLTIVKLAAVLEVSPDTLLLGIDWLVVESYQPLGVVLIDGRRVDQDPVGV